MKMRKFGIITNGYKDPNLNMTHMIADYIRNKGGEATIITEDHGEILDYEAMNYAKIPEGVEMLLVLGGDGTLIRVATGIRQNRVPLIGVNLGTLGYLCEVDTDSIYQAIDALMVGDYTIEERMMLKGKTPDNDKTRSALNDIVIHRSGSLSILQLHLYVNGEKLCTYNADGIILSTPTGSTGYNMSAGGPIVDPQANLIVLTPINAHTLNTRSIVLSADDTIEVEMGSRRFQRDEVALVSCDGDAIVELKVGDRFQITKSDHIIQIVKLSKESFLEILSKKMG